MHKLKNPRKYVERLKTRIAELQESHSTVWDLVGVAVEYLAKCGMPELAN